MNQVSDDERDVDIIEDDEEVNEQVEWEEELESQYGDSDDSMKQKRSKAMGPGFSKQKQVMEENKFYRGDIKKQVNIKK